MFMNSILKNTYILKKIQEVEVDEVYGTTEQIATEYEISGIMIDLTSEDLIHGLAGKYEVGDSRGYFNQSYSIGKDIVTVEVNDILVKEGKEYRVDLVTDYNWSSTIQVREIYARRIKT